MFSSSELFSEESLNELYDYIYNQPSIPVHSNPITPTTTTNEEAPARTYSPMRTVSQLKKTRKANVKMLDLMEAGYMEAGNAIHLLYHGKSYEGTLDITGTINDYINN
jgi:hypothetical protein